MENLKIAVAVLAGIVLATIVRWFFSPKEAKKK